MQKLDSDNTNFGENAEQWEPLYIGGQDYNWIQSLCEII